MQEPKDQAVDSKADAQPVQPVQQSPEEEAKVRHNLALVEAALYVAGRPLDLNELCGVLGSRSKKKAKGLVAVLMQEYAARNTALEVLGLKDERFVLQLKAVFTPLVKRLVNRPLLSSGPLKTLSYIAYRQPISQKRVIEVRGQHAYGHIKVLKEMGLVAAERSGRSMSLRTTDYFADYFGLTQDTAVMKKDLKRIFGEAVKEESQAQKE
jgi:segregation and condensation protein B